MEQGLILTPQVEGEFSLNAAQSVRWKGQDYAPSEFKAYAVARFGFAFPHVNHSGEAVHPAVLAKSFAGADNMVDTPVNLGHELKYWGRNQDRIVGCVRDAEFPKAPGALWRAVPLASAPSGRALIALHKHAAGMDKVLGRHLAARHHYVVSQEFHWRREESGFAVQVLEGDERLASTPDDLWALGFNYVPVSEADEQLMATRAWKAARMATKQPDGSYAGDLDGRRTYMLMNGLDGAPLLYTGIAIVEHGKEGLADLETLLAARTGRIEDEAGFRAAIDALCATLQKMQRMD